MPFFQLTQEQRHIVEAKSGHYVITAVAGSGKTTTLAHRIQFLLNQGIDPRRMLVLMFNKAAQLDFNAKLQGLIPKEQSKPEVRTFHAMGYRLYQRFIQEGALKPFHQKIISEKETQFQCWLLISRHLEPAKVKEIKRDKKEHLTLCTQFIETAKSTLSSPQEVFEELDLNSKFHYFVELFDHFEDWRKQHARIGYSDMLYDPVKAIKQYPHLRSLVTDKMDVVLVDEYQDTNEIQHELLKLIAGTRAKVTVVGDPDQTIYEFRGAKPEYIIKGFSHEFPEAEALNLSYSFRYGHKVALLANHLISNNQSRQNLICKSHQSNPNTNVQIHSQSGAVMALLKSYSHEDLNQSAVLVRSWSQTVGLELNLLEANIPYHIAGHPGIFHSEEMVSISALLEIATGTFSQMTAEARREKLEKLFRFPHVGVPEGTIQGICQRLASAPQGWGKLLMDVPTSELNKIQSIKIERLALALAVLENSKRAAHDLLQRYIEQTDLFEGIRSLSLSHEHAEEKIQSIKGIIRFVSGLSGNKNQILAHLNELKDSAAQQQQESAHTKRLHISTIHRAKGLEWSNVLIPDFKDKVFPYVHHKDSQLTSSYLESERRLLYVAMTRSIHSLHLFTPERNTQHAQPSKFQRELKIEESLLHGQKFASQTATDHPSSDANTLINRYQKEFLSELEPA